MTQYLIWSNEQKAWWRPAHCGYTFHIEAAGRYTHEEALAVCKAANRGFYRGEIPNEILVSEADALAAMQADEKPKVNTNYDDEEGLEQ